MDKVRRGDLVEVIKGKDSGKKGKIIKLLSEGSRALVEGINLVKKHKRRTSQDQQGGIVQIEAPIQLCNLMVVCKNCGRGVRVGFTVLKDGGKARVCKACKEVI